ncbi:PIGL [Lepeophtheirus salmonis]|uniref:N-acetylglucosaminylphosphatidylinositol deacetylase n=1 Tax=Lepeophtheirus salmonis TaxID=72036 RepID=A0A7R8H185_LEPSM|nr:PIGL [Lepeophtheirus salmonis]CAF2804710.1 PIGL [Lepeophtheirus salmonis]
MKDIQNPASLTLHEDTFGFDVELLAFGNCLRFEEITFGEDGVSIPMQSIKGPLLIKIKTTSRKQSRLNQPIVIAHPDDEVMFFGPTIANLTRDHEMNVHLLVLSRGNFRGEGNLRKMELYKAAEALSISKDNITLLNYTKLQDNPKARWSEELVADIIYQYVESQDIGVILSFDRFGVSGHKNHSSIYNALLLLTSEERSQSFRSNNTRILVFK